MEMEKRKDAEFGWNKLDKQEIYLFDGKNKQLDLKLTLKVGSIVISGNILKVGIRVRWFL